MTNDPHTMKNFRVRVSSFANEKSVYLRSTINGKGTNCSVSIIGTGIFEDTSDIDIVTKNDHIGYVVSPPTAKMVIDEVYADFSTPLSEFNTDKKREARLQKRVERLTSELEQERIESNKSKKIIDWFTGDNGSFYKSDVEEDDNE